jgi:fumarylacetoacetase
MGGEGLTELFSLEEWSRKSWVESANEAECGFPLQSLPYCILDGKVSCARPGVGIGDQVLDLGQCSCAGCWTGCPSAVRRACQASTLNPLLECGSEAHDGLRTRLMDLLDARAGEAVQDTVRSALRPMQGARLLKPIEPANYTDFYASIDHATNVGRIFRPEQPLLPNYKFVPIGYHGRTSSLVVSGTGVWRPSGQTRPPTPGASPGFGPSEFLDYEVEVGMYIGGGNALGEPIPIEGRREAYLRHHAGQRLVGPRYAGVGVPATRARSWPKASLPAFLPGWCQWRHLRRFRVPASPRSVEDPAPLAYLRSDEDQRVGGLDLTVEVFLLTARDAHRAPAAPPAQPREHARSLLDSCADDCAPHQQRMQPAASRPCGHRDRLRRRRECSWVSAGAHAWRRKAASVAQRREPHGAGGW